MRIGVEAQFVHPNWDYSVIDNDIMLFKLAEDIEFNDAVSPVCLPTSSDDELSDGIIVQTTGWGRVQCKCSMISGSFEVPKTLESMHLRSSTLSMKSLVLTVV